MSSRLTILAAAVVCALAVFPAGRCLALSASNVLVLYNAASPDGQAIADYYAQVHPGVTLLALTERAHHRGCVIRHVSEYHPAAGPRPP